MERSRDERNSKGGASQGIDQNASQRDNEKSTLMGSWFLNFFGSWFLKKTPRRVLKTGDVFRESAYELDHTYVARPHIETDVRNKLRHDNAIVLFSGPTKSGKTVLCHRFADERRCAHIHAFQTMTADEFWSALRQAIEAPETMEIVTERERALATRRGAKITGGVPGLSADLTAEETENETTRTSRRAVVPQAGRIGVINFLQSNPHTIIIDDFHWMNPAIKIDVFPPLKQLLGYRSRVILISVSKSAFPTIGDFSDFTGRFIDLSMPAWEPAEVRKIALVGFPLLGMDVSSDTVDHLVACSYMSPMLMQGLCAQLCFENDILQTAAETVRVDIPTRNEVGKMAGRYAKPLTTSFDPILDDSGERTWPTKPRDGRRLTIAEVLVLGISHRRPFEPFPLSDLVARLEERVLQRPVSETLPAQLVRKTLEIQKKYGGDRRDRSPIYYDGAAKTITIVDPYFKLWARWVRGPALGGNLFPE